MMRILLTALAIAVTQALAGPMPVAPITNAATPTPTPPPPKPLDKREGISFPASGCKLTSFSSVTLTEYSISFSSGTAVSIPTYDTISGASGCACAGGAQVGLLTSADTAGNELIYCNTGTGQPTGPPITTIANSALPLCTASKDIDVWSSYNMPSFVVSQADALVPYSTGFADAIQSELPMLAANDYSCEWSFGGKQCDPADVFAACSQNPQDAFVLAAIANLVNYFDDIFNAFKTIVTDVTPAFGNFPETFNPNNITTLPGGSTPAGIASSSLYFMGSLAAIIPGFGLVEAGSTAAKGFGQLGAVAYMGGSAAGVENLGPGLSGSLETQFDDFSAISSLLGDLATGVSNGFTTFLTSRMNQIPPVNFASDPQQLPQILSDGSFAAPHPPFSLSMAQNLTAAVAGPGINLLWQYSGTVIAKVNKNNLPVDPCDGDTLFDASVKYCDSDGNMFVIQTKPNQAFGGSINDGGLTDPTKWAVPGFDKIGSWNLTVYDIVTSAWNNQVANGPASTGPDPQTFINNLIAEQPTSVPRDQYIFFNLFVCDYDANQWSGDAVSLGQTQCGDYNADNAMCYFYFMLAAVCPLQFPNFQGGTKWPWGYVWLTGE